MATVITAMGHYFPSNLIQNSFFDELDIGSDETWVVERTGIKTRHSVLSPDNIRKLRRGETTITALRAAGEIESIADMSLHAFNHLQSRQKQPIDPSKIELVVAGVSIPDYDVPANAAVASKLIGAEAPCFDINSACSSFVVNLHTIEALVSKGHYKKALLLNPERYTLRTDFSDRSSCILFGDASVASILEKDAPHGLEVLDTMILSAPSKWDAISIPVNGHFYQNGHAVQKFAVTRTIEATQQILERNKLKISDVNYMVGHQANLRMLTSAVDRLGFKPEQHLFNVDRCGNQGGAGAPSVLSMYWDKFKPGDLVVVAVVGAGLTWGSTLLRMR